MLSIWSYLGSPYTICRSGSASNIVVKFNSHTVGIFSPPRYLHGHHVVTYLSTMEHSGKFSRQITDTLDASVRNNELWDPSEAAEAFLSLEKYALNLLDYPWKTEFRQLKVLLLNCFTILVCITILVAV